MLKANYESRGLNLVSLLIAIGTLLSPSARAVGTWTALAHTAPGVQINNMLLLTDGTVLAHDVYSAAAWYKLTPDSTGSYVNGTWTTVASMNYTREYYSSQVLINGQVFVAGGEYGSGSTNAEYYDPIANTWTMAPATPGLNKFLDSCSEILPSGNVMVSPVAPANFGETLIWNTNNTWTVGATLYRGDDQDEACWVKLPDNSILTIDPYGQNSERYIPSLNKWINDGTVPVTMYGWGGEMGAGFLLPNGNVFYLGGTNHTAIYAPTGTTNAGTWTAGPNIPNNYGVIDGPGAMLVNGKILCCVGTNGSYAGPSYFYEYDYNANAFTAAPSPTSGTAGASFSPAPFVCAMLDLPDGSVLLSRQSSQLYVYKPDGSPLAAGQPAISNITVNADGSLHVTGTLLNGISEGAAYGDDLQMSSNYPLARTTNSSGQVLYARTLNRTSTGVMTGTNLESTDVILPSSLTPGSYPLAIVANGNVSAPVQFTYPSGFTWDANISISGVQDGSGTWGSNANWWNGVSDLAWNDVTPYIAYFGNGGTAGTVTVSSAHTNSWIVFNPVGGSYTLTGGGSLTISNGINASDSATLNVPVVLAVNQVWTVGTNNTLTLENGLSAEVPAPLSLAGPGTLALATSNNVLGANITGVNFADTANNSILGIVNSSQAVGTLTVQDGATGLVAGNGTLAMNGMDWYFGSSNLVSDALNFSGLANFAYNAPANTFSVGTSFFPVAGTGATTLNLGLTNTIIAANFDVAGYAGLGQYGFAGTLYLGQTNLINASNVSIGNTKQSGSVAFASGLANAGVMIRATDGTDPAAMTVGLQNNFSAQTITATFDSSGGYLDGLLSSLVIGDAADRDGIVNANFKMGGGTLTVPSAVVGEAQGATSGSYTRAGNGTFELAGGSASITNIILANNISTAGTGTATTSGTLLLDSGVLRAATIQSGSSSGGAITAACVWSDGTLGNLPGSNLTVSGFNLALTNGGNLSGVHTFDVTGTQSAPIQSAITGMGSIVKTSTGSLVLAATNTYTGSTVISNGTCALAATGSIAGSALVNVAAGAVFDVSAINNYSLGAGQILSGNGSINGNVIVPATAQIAPGLGGTAGTLLFSNNLTLNAPVLGFDLSANPASGNDQVQILGGVTNNGTALINLNYQSGSLGAGTYTLVTYSSQSGSGNFALNHGYRNVTLNVGPTAVTLTVGANGSSVANLTWKGDGTSNVWDVQNSTNWLNTGNPDVFYQNDNVTFNDSGSDTPAINLATNLMAGSVTVNSAQNYTFSGNGAITGPTGLTKQGTGTLYLKNTNTYAGITTVSGGALELDATRAASTNSIALGSNALNVNIGASTLANTVNGSGAINVIETSGANTTLGSSLSNFTGNVSLPASPGGSAKAIISSTAVSLNSHATVNLASGGTLYLTGTGVILTASNNVAGTGNSENLGALRVEGNAVVSGPVNLTATAAIGANSGIGTLSGTISDGGNGFGISKVGVGTIVLAGTNTFSGPVNFSAGQLDLNSPKALGSGTLAISGVPTIDNTSGSSITLNNNPETWDANFTFLGSNPLNLGTGAVTLDVNVQVTVKTNTLTVGGPIGDGGHGYGLTFGGAATNTLAGNNTYTGPTTVSNGTVNVTGNESAATGGWFMPINIATTTVNFQPGSTVVVGSGNSVQIGSSPSSGTPNYQTLNASGKVTNNGTLLVARGGVLNLNSNWVQTGALNIIPPASSGYGAQVTINPGGTLTYAGTNLIVLSPSSGNSGAGELSILGGKFTTGRGFTNTVASSTGSASILITNGGTLAFSANVPNLLATAGSTESFQLGAGGGVLDTSAFSVTITNPITGVGSLTKLSAGTLTLSGVNAYSGATTVSAGKFVGVTSGSCADTAIAIASGATNGVQLASAGGQWTCDGLTFNSGTAYADFNFNGYTPSTTTAPILVNGNLALSGTLDIIVRSSVGITAGNYPLIKYTGTLSGTVPTTPLVLLPGMTATIVNDTANSSIDLDVTVAGYPVATWAVGNGTWDTTTANWLLSGVAGTYQDGDYVVFDDTASGTSPITVTLNNTFNPSSVTANVTNKSYTISGTGTIGGSATLAKTGSNTLVLATANTYTGGTTIAANGGILQISNPLALGNGSITISKSGSQTGTLQLALTGANTITNAFAGFSSSTFAGNTTVPDIENVSGTNILTGNLIVTGTGGNGITLESDTGLMEINGTISSTLSSRGVELNGAGNGIVNGAITNATGNAAFTLNKDGVGTWTLAGTNTFSGNTTVSTGALLVNGITGNGAVTVSSGATVGGSGTINGAITLNGTVAPGGAGVGTLNTVAETWNAGSTYLFSLNNATNGSGEDLLNITGALNLSSTASNAFTINVISLTSSNVPGPVSGFVGSGTYAWPMAIASGGVGNFNPAAFALNTTAFSNAFTGTFSVTTNGNALEVAYTPANLSPPSVSASVSQNGGAFSLNFGGPFGQTYRVLMSTNLMAPMTNWLVLTNGTFGSGPVNFTDSAATNVQGYYRVASP